MSRDIVDTIAAELADAVGDHYDNGKAADPNILWHGSGMPSAIDWSGAVRTLLQRYVIIDRDTALTAAEIVHSASWGPGTAERIADALFDAVRWEQ